MIERFGKMVHVMAQQINARLKKRCPRCGKLKNLSDFGKWMKYLRSTKTREARYQSHCKKCRTKFRRAKGDDALDFSSTYFAVYGGLPELSTSAGAINIVYTCDENGIPGARHLLTKLYQETYPGDNKHKRSVKFMTDKLTRRKQRDARNSTT